VRVEAAVCVLVFGMSSGTPAAAQINAPGPPGPYVIDIRGAAGGIPQDSAFFPPVPAATIIPSSGSGIEIGAHVYLIQRLRRSRRHQPRDQPRPRPALRPGPTSMRR